jgi:hypothetical protein
MPTDPAAALERLVDALRDHLRASVEVRDPDDDAVLDAAADVADAFDAYDEALFDATGVDTPLDLIDEDDDEDDESDDDDLEAADHVDDRD